MTELIESYAQNVRRDSGSQIFRQEDWWAVWIGLGLIAVAVLLLASGNSIKWVAIAPTKWSHPGEALAQVREHAPQYSALFALWAVLLGFGTSALGFRRRYAWSFISRPASSCWVPDCH